MKRQMACYILLMAALLALLVTLKYTLPQQQEKTPLSVLVLREGEGSAVIVTCGGQTLLLLPEEADDMEHLADYLKKERTLRVEQVVRTNHTPLPAAIENTIATANVTVLSAADEVSLTNADVTVLSSEDEIFLSDTNGTILPTAEEVFLSDAVCSIAHAEDGTLTFAVSHGKNQLLLYLSADAQPEASMNGQPSTLETEQHSVRILSNGTRFSLRPDFSAWND